MAMLKLYNTLTKKVEDFKPLSPDVVTIYACGPTVYSYAHIGNFRTYVMTDILVRTLKYFGYNVKFAMNITDVGHLTSDSDTGEDKMEKGAKREGKTAWEIAKFYTDAFLFDSKKLNLLEPDFRPKPTEHIPEQIAMVQKLMDKGFAYQIDDGIYFDTSKFKDYGKLTGQNLEELKAGARVEVNPQKKNPTDFALWKFSYPQGDSLKTARRLLANRKKRDMEWDNPWGKGFPGWHIECSAMSRKYLGDQIDIHTGGMDLIPIHHTNEIAQSEAATGKSPFVRYWVHGQFILINGEKMAKSRENFYRLADIEAKGYDPLALRYLYLTAHYRAFLNFTWEALANAQRSLKELRSQILNFKFQISNLKRNTVSQEKLTKIEMYHDKFDNALKDDLNIPQALATVWEVVKSNVPSQDKYDLLLDFDEVLGLNLKEAISDKQEAISTPKEIEDLIKKREVLRNEKKFAEADEIRKEIEAKGYLLEDLPEGTRVKKNEILNAHSKFHPERSRRGPLTPGLVVLFGSGEMSPTGRKIQEEVFKLAKLLAPVKIGILETPTGFEVNAIHGWPERMQKFFETSLANFKPQVTRIRAWNKVGEHSTNDPKIVNAILDQDYLYCGAGSPGYTVKHLKDSLAYSQMLKLHENGGVLSLGSATAVAVSRWAIPVYEIFKTGAELGWLSGLDLFGRYGMNLAIIPHWNNQEGEDFDTTRCYMGKMRFARLKSKLDKDVTILGIDEQTACVFDFQEKQVKVIGVGNVRIVKGSKEQVFASGESFPFSSVQQ